MAGDWIPIRTDLITTNEVVEIATITGLDRFYICGLLVAFWSWVQSQTTDGHVRFLSRACPKDVLTYAVGGSQTFWDAVERTGWIIFGDPSNPEEPSIEIPNFNNWLSNGAKKRLIESRRKRDQRMSAKCPQVVPQLSQEKRDKKRTKAGPEKRREEKRREEESISHSAARLPDPFYEKFAVSFGLKYEVKYRSKNGDFVQLAALKKNADPWTLADWARAVENYFATPQDSHTLADLCVSYATFHKHALDRYRKPVGEGNGQAREVGSARVIPGKYDNVGSRQTH